MVLQGMYIYVLNIISYIYRFHENLGVPKTPYANPSKKECLNKGLLQDLIIP